jgi:hypothetical protein
MKMVIVGGLITVVGGGIVGGSFTLANTELSKASPSQSNPPTAMASVAAARPTSSGEPAGTAPVTAFPSATAISCQDKLRLTSPAEDSSFESGNQAVLTVAGTACDLGSDSGWLFDYDPDDHYYYDDFTGSAPAPVVQGAQSTWKFPDQAVGDPGDQNKRYAITLVLASPSCAQRLRTTQIDGDYKVRAFPEGCTVADTRDVYVTYP